MSTHPHFAGARPPRTVKVRLHSPRFKVPSYVRFLAELRQLHTHYGKLTGMSRARSFPCAEGETCRHCKSGVPYFSKWYAPALVFQPDHGDWIQEVVEVSENLWLTLRSEPIFGTEWKLVRNGDKEERSPVTGEKLGEVSVNELVEPCEIEEFLRGFYRVEYLPSPGESKLPIRETATSVQGTLPRGYVAGKDRKATEPKPVDPDVKRAWREAKSRLAGTLPTEVPGASPVPDLTRNGSANGHAVPPK